MKTVHKSLLIGGIVSAVGVAGVAGTGIASAESGQTGTDPDSSLVQQLASKFNLNKADVQKVFDENKATREADREKKQSERLQKLVDDKTITAAQKTAIEAKIKELKAQRESNKDSMKDLTEEQRKAKRDQEKTNLESWAKQQGLDLTKLKGVLEQGPGMRGPKQ